MSSDKPISPFPISLSQNPSSLLEEGQEYKEAMRKQVEEILKQFLRVLPSNYVAQTTGPFYTIQFQAMAEALAKVQISAQQLFLDSSYDFTRSEFLWQILGRLVFPKITENQIQIPHIDSDVEYREFLKNMVVLLLEGSPKASIEKGVSLLTEAQVSIIEKSIASRIKDSAWDYHDQYTFEVNLEQDGGTEFPKDPFKLEYNISVILDALKPAHTLYEYRHVFKEVFGHIFQDSMTLQQNMYHYDDLRKFCYGAKNITGTGTILSDRHLISDPQKSFASVPVGAIVTINNSFYEVQQVLVFPMGDDSNPRWYTTSPTGLQGYVTIEDDVLTDPCQNWTLAMEGEIITISEGSNAGSYRLQDVLGSYGGSVGFVSGLGTQVRASPSIVKTTERMPVSDTPVDYAVTVDRLGVQEKREVVGEDLSNQCYL